MEFKDFFYIHHKVHFLWHYAYVFMLYDSYYYFQRLLLLLLLLFYSTLYICAKNPQKKKNIYDSVSTHIKM